MLLLHGNNHYSFWSLTRMTYCLDIQFLTSLKCLLTTASIIYFSYSLFVMYNYYFRRWTHKVLKLHDSFTSFSLTQCLSSQQIQMKKIFFIYSYSLSHTIKLPLPNPRRRLTVLYLFCNNLVFKECKVYYFALNDLPKEDASANTNLHCDNESLNFLHYLYAHSMSCSIH